MASCGMKEVAIMIQVLFLHCGSWRAVGTQTGLRGKEIGLAGTVFHHGNQDCLGKIVKGEPVVAGTDSFLDHPIAPFHFRNMALSWS